MGAVHTHKKSKMSCVNSNEVVFFLVGDSDISRWPADLLPSLSDHPALEHHNINQTIYNEHCKSGALLQQTADQVKRYIKDFKNSALNDKHSLVFFIACAGENDLSNGFSVDTIVASFQKLCDTIFAESSCASRPYLIFFGPKLEPWLDEDSKARRSYYQLSERLAETCLRFSVDITQGQDHDQGHCHCDGKNITYVDCLTIFCGESANESGAVLSGKAKAETKYFDNDGLHLNEVGYKIWKDKLEIILSQIICSERCINSLDMSHGMKIELK